MSDDEIVYPTSPYKVVASNLEDQQFVLLTNEEIIAMGMDGDVDQYDKAAHMRDVREIKLIDTDGYASLSDRPMSDAMRDYRQALRDITTHANWPDLEDDDWPVKPEE